MYVYKETNSNSLCTQPKSPKSPESTLLDDIVGISVENEIITNLPEPVRIRFRHSALPVSLFDHFICVPLIFCLCYNVFVVLLKEHATFLEIGSF